jgi:type II secretory pathway pseudopilin PulG
MARPGACGASIIEAVAAVSLITLLLLVALPRLSVPAEVEVRQVARVVAADLDMARRLAIARRRDYVVAFAPPGGPYATYTVQPTGGTPEPGFPKTLPAGVTVTGTGSLTFAPSGAASVAALLTFSVGGVSAQLQVVAATGHVRLVLP